MLAFIFWLFMEEVEFLVFTESQNRIKFLWMRLLKLNARNGNDFYLLKYDRFLKVFMNLSYIL